MFYKLNTLCREELERLYIAESQRLYFASQMKMPHNDIHAIKINLNYLDRELRKKNALKKFSKN
jgi:hypothetical protein